MVLPITRLGQIYSFCTIPWLVVVSLSFSTIRMANIISVVLFKLISVNIVFLCKFLLPKPKWFIHWQSNPLQEQTQLQTTIMLKMMLLFHYLIKCLHTWGELYSCMVIKLTQVDFVTVSRSFNFVDVEVDGVVVWEPEQHTLNALIFQY